MLALLRFDPDLSVRLQAVIAMGRIGNPWAVQFLLPLVASDDEYLAFSARKALKRIGVWNETAKGLDSPDAKVRAGVLLAMEMVYDRDAASALREFAADPHRDSFERARAVFLLSQGHRKPIPWDGQWWGTQPAKRPRPEKSIDWEGTPEVLAALRERLVDPVVPVRSEAVTAVAETADPDALAILRDRFAGETDAPIRVESARVFGALKDKEALPLLVASVRDRTSPETLRDASLKSIEAIGSSEALKALLGLLEDDALSTEKLPRVIAALGRFKSAEAASALLKALKSPAAAVRAAAAEALGSASTAKLAGEPVRALLADPAVEVQGARPRRSASRITGRSRP